MMKKWLVLLLVFFLLESFGTQGISAAETPQQNQLYVANTENDCFGYTNCFFNDSTDLPESNALMKAIKFARDNNGRPDLLNDLFFTPFVIGYEQAGVLSFTASVTTSAINLNWTTVTEVNTLNFHIARSTSSDGTYEKISGDIAATGSPSSGSSYSFSDSTAVAGQTYYYKLVVINSDGSVQQMVGPVSASVAPLPAATNTRTPTRTLTPTRTITPTRTLTPFRTATSAFKTPLPDEPTLFLPTFTDTPTTEIPPDLSLTPAETPTPTSTPSRTATPTVSGTPNSGLLGKTDRYSGQKQVPFYLGGVAVLILLVLLAVYIHRKY